MKKAVIAAILVLAVVAAIAVFKSSPAESGFAGVQSSDRVAASVHSKIDAIKKADADKKRRVQQKVDVSEAELEAYVLTDMKKDFPVHMDAFHVQLTPGMVGATARLTVPAGSTGNFLLDALVTGTHNFISRGKVTGSKGVGKFDLTEFSVDGIPLPGFLVDFIFKRYVKAKHPEADLNSPFDLPWGIDAVDVGQGKATITY